MTLKQIQHLLSALAEEYPGNGLSPGPVDGLSGPKTSAAIRAFQKAFSGLEVTGAPDEATEKALRHAIAYGLDIPEESRPRDFWAEIPNFTRQEFACKCGQYCDGFPAEPMEAMVRLAQAARTHFGRPATIVSGLRCRRHNTNVGGVADSQHMYGEACDIYISGVAQSTVLAWFLAQPGVRYAYAIDGSNNVHFDIPKGDR